jgi:D-aspartate ligase
VTAEGESWPGALLTPVLVFQVANNFLTHSSLAIARSAGRVGVPVYGLYAGRRAPEARSRYWTGQFRHPGPGASDKEWLQTLDAIGAELRRAVLITTDDAATVLAARLGDRLAEHFVFPHQPLELVRLLANKRQVHELCTQVGIPVPETAFPQSRTEVAERAEASRFPIVVKRIAAWEPSQRPGATTVAIVRTADRLFAAYDAMESPVAPNVLLQEYIPGADGTQAIHNGYFDQSSRCLVSFTGRKLRQRGTHSGPATLGEAVSNPEVERLTLQLAAAAGYRGILDMDFRYDSRDDRYKLLDANPRVGSSFRMFVGANGIDVFRAMYLDMNDHPVPASVHRDGKWIVEPLDVVTAWREWRRGELRGGAWLESIRGVREATWFARDDPRPFASMLAACAAYGVRRKVMSGR